METILIEDNIEASMENKSVSWQNETSRTDENAIPMTKITITSTTNSERNSPTSVKVASKNTALQRTASDSSSLHHIGLKTPRSLGSKHLRATSFIDIRENYSGTSDNELSDQTDKIEAVYKKKFPGDVLLSPTDEWQRKKHLKNMKRKLPERASQIIKAGWRIRYHLQKTKRSGSKSVHAFYLETVSTGCVEEVEVLFNCAKTDPTLTLHKNYVNQHGIDALRIAIENKDLPMVKLLLNNQVKLKFHLLHAININFLEGVEEILKRDKSTDVCVKTFNYHFNVGMTPLLLAAHNNNYEILKLLYKNGHTAKETEANWHGNLEKANQRIMLCTAKASPAYITLICEVQHKSPIQYCISLIKTLRTYTSSQPEFSEEYQTLEHQVEDYMCCLLDQIKTSEELSQFFEYDYEVNWRKSRTGSIFGEGRLSTKITKSRLNTLHATSDINLVKFVTHRNSQLALSYIRHRSVPPLLSILKSDNKLKRFIAESVVGLLFPLWCGFYLLAPNSDLGGLITLPDIAFASHIGSEVMFLGLLVAHAVTKSPQTEYLGAPPNVLEWLIVAWVIGKFIAEVTQCKFRGPKTYFRDWWNYLDIIPLLLFTAVFIFRVLDYLIHRLDQERTKRNKWAAFDWRLLSTGFLAWVYVFVFLRVLSLIRTNRIIGPLQISLAKMMVDVGHFFSIFLVVLFSFALALTELFWFNGTLECSGTSFNLKNDTRCNEMFSSVGLSLSDLFWSLFGYLDLAELPYNDQLVFTYFDGLFLLGTYHVFAIVILINMLIAMMARTFDVISQNREVEWKFHRTVVWIAYVQQEFTRPPPMNLFPTPYSIYRKICKVFRWIAINIFCVDLDSYRRRGRKRTQDEELQHQLRNIERESFYIRKNLRKILSQKAEEVLVERYKFFKLLNNENRQYEQWTEWKNI